MNGSWRHRVVAGISAAITLLSITWGQIAAAAELRSLQLYHVHTGDSLTITYKRDGQYVPSAMAQLDYFLRDWRTNGLVSMSGETIDLMWELHQELGSKEPIRIICGFRSAETNALLKRIGRHVAVRSQHILGRAIDLQFPDVPLERLRNSALVRQAGGVGYYPGRAGGFVHLDSGNVRHWPWISQAKLAAIFAEHTGSLGDKAPQLASNALETAPMPPPPRPKPTLDGALASFTDRGR